MAAARLGRRMLFVLFLIGVFNAVDRHILVVLLEPIRLEFGASDAVMGALTGFAFVAFYALATVPIARLSDSRPRRVIVLAGLSFWSAMTAATGLATSLWHVAVARLGVGVGEASFLPAGMSMVSDRFPPARRALAIAALSAAYPVGIMTSLVVGSRMGAALGWRSTMLWLGLAGLALSAVVALTLAEPERGGAEEDRGDVELYSLRDTLRYLGGLSSIRHLGFGAALSFFASISVAAWSPTFLIRVHGLDLATAGTLLGPATGVGGITGLILGGSVAQRLARRDIRWLLWAPVMTELLALPFALVFLLLPDVRAAVPAYVGVTLFGGAMMGPVMASVQGIAKVRMRALAAALVSTTINLVGLGLGPFVAGALSDALEPRFGLESIRYALLGTACVSLWAAFHFRLAARTVGEEFERAGAAPFDSAEVKPLCPSDNVQP